MLFFAKIRKILHFANHRCVLNNRYSIIFRVFGETSQYKDIQNIAFYLKKITLSVSNRDSILNKKKLFFKRPMVLKMLFVVFLDNKYSIFSSQSQLIYPDKEMFIFSFVLRCKSTRLFFPTTKEFGSTLVFFFLPREIGLNFFLSCVASARNFV